MPTQETNTAADRLYRIIRDMYAIQNENLVSAWAKVLGLPKADRLEVFRGILSLAALVDEVENTVQRQGGNAAQLYLRSLKQVRYVLMSGIDNHRANLNGLLKPEVINDLEHCAAMYSNLDHEISVPKDQIDSIRNRVEELFQGIAKSNLPEDLRNKLLDLLEVIRQQISQFEIRGVTALHECLRQSLARLMEIYPAVQKKQRRANFQKTVRRYDRHQYDV
jgi:hypothetical protein